MPGLLNMQQGANGEFSLPDAGRPALPAQEGSTTSPGEDQPNVTPEEQAVYDQFVDNAYNVIYDEKTLPKILERLKGKDPIESLASVAATTVMRLEDSAQVKGKEVSPDVLLHGGTEILEDLAQLAERAGIHEYNEQELEGALYRAMDLYRNMKGSQGEIDQKAMGAEFDQIMQADKAGSLEDLIPGIGKKGAPPNA